MEDVDVLLSISEIASFVSDRPFVRKSVLSKQPNVEFMPGSIPIGVSAMPQWALYTLYVYICTT